MFKHAPFSYIGLPVEGELKRFFFPFPSVENRLLLSSSQGTVGIGSSRQPNADPGS